MVVMSTFVAQQTGAGGWRGGAVKFNDDLGMDKMAAWQTSQNWSYSVLTQHKQFTTVTRPGSVREHGHVGHHEDNGIMEQLTMPDMNIMDKFDIMDKLELVKILTQGEGGGVRCPMIVIIDAE